MTHRRDQINSTLQRAIQETIARGLSDPRIGGLITVTGVDVSPDLKTATVLVSVLPAQRQDLTMHGLQDAAQHVRRRVGDLVAMKQVPELRFKVDVSLKQQAAAYEAIAKAAAERERGGPGQGWGRDRGMPEGPGGEGGEEENRVRD